jgi:hypothetical protein
MSQIENQPSSQTVASEDRQQLKLLAWLHYVLGGITAAAFPLGIWIAWAGKPLLYPPPRPPGEYVPGEEISIAMGAALIKSGVLVAAICLMHGAVLAYLGRCLARLRRRRLVVAVSIFNLTYIPLGTVISLFTLIVLARPSVKWLFHQPAEAAEVAPRHSA